MVIGGVVAFIFPNHVEHSMVHNLVGPTDDIMSAGFCEYCNVQEKMTCWGKSTSLGVSSQEMDAEIIGGQLNM